MGLQFCGTLQFQFLNSLSFIYTDCDLLFYIDKNQCWYHKGIQGITNNIDSTVLFLNKIIKDGNYEKVIFMGISAGWYASILFGSLCNNINKVISFNPQTILNNQIDLKYSNLKNIINKNTKYIMFWDTSIQNKNDNHDILQCKNIECFSNVKIIKINGLDMRQLRDNGSIKELLDGILL
jgi:hypothetical protein